MDGGRAREDWGRGYAPPARPWRGAPPAGEFVGVRMRAFTLAEGGFPNAFQECVLFRVSAYRLLPEQPRNVAFVKTEKNMAEEITVLSNFLTLKTVLQFTSHSINTSIKILVVSFSNHFNCY